MRVETQTTTTHQLHLDDDELDTLLAALRHCSQQPDCGLAIRRMTAAVENATDRVTDGKHRSAQHHPDFRAGALGQA